MKSVRVEWMNVTIYNAKWLNDKINTGWECYMKLILCYFIAWAFNHLAAKWLKGTLKYVVPLIYNSITIVIVFALKICQVFIIVFEIKKN